jgi:hypothetical protein
VTQESVVTKPLHAIQAGDLQDLVDRGVPEGPLEYKGTLDLSTEANKLKIADDVSAFANTDGGRILFGIEEEKVNGTPVASKVVGLKDGGVVAAFADVMHSIIQPSPRFSLVQVEVSDGFVLVVDVPHSVTDLHMVSGFGKSRYVRRGPTGNVPMRESEVREAYARLLAARNALDARERDLTASELAIRKTTEESVMVTALYGSPDFLDPRHFRAIREELAATVLPKLRFSDYPLNLDLVGDGYRGLLPWKRTNEDAAIYVAVLKAGLVHGSSDLAFFGDAKAPALDFSSWGSVVRILRVLLLARFVFGRVGYTGPSRLRYILRAKKALYVDRNPNGIYMLEGPPKIDAGQYEGGPIDAYLQQGSLEPLVKDLVDPILHHVGEVESKWFESSGMLKEGQRKELPGGISELLSTL